MQVDFASVTNARSRGLLPLQFLAGQHTPSEFLERLDLVASIPRDASVPLTLAPSLRLPVAAPVLAPLCDCSLTKSGHVQSDYNGVNLVVGDLRQSQVAAGSNRGEAQKTGPIVLQAGHHGVSNGCLHSTWPKVCNELLTGFKALSKDAFGLHPQIIHIG